MGLSWGIEFYRNPSTTRILPSIQESELVGRHHLSNIRCACKAGTQLQCIEFQLPYVWIYTEDSPEKLSHPLTGTKPLYCFTFCCLYLPGQQRSKNIVDPQPNVGLAFWPSTAKVNITLPIPILDVETCVTQKCLIVPSIRCEASCVHWLYRAHTVLDPSLPTCKGYRIPVSRIEPPTTARCQFSS